MLKSRLKKIDADSKELLKASTIAFAIKIIATALAFGLNIILARQLGAEGSGIYFLAVTVVLFVATFGRLGLENSLVRFIAANVSRDQPKKVLGVYHKAMLYSLVISIILSVLLYLFAPILSQSLFKKPALEKPLILLAFSVVPLALFTLHAYALQGLKRVAESVTVLSVIVPLVTSVIALLFVPKYGITAAVWGYLLATFMALLLGKYFWQRAVAAFNTTDSAFDTKELLSSSMPLFTVVIMNMAITLLPTLFLGVWENSENVGIYSTASRTALLMSFILVAVNSIAAPKFSALYQQGNIYALGKLARNAAKIMFVLAIPALLILLLIPEWILSLFGDEFKRGSTVLMILAVGQFVNVTTGSVGFLLMMSGNERLMRNILVFSALLSVVLNIWLISDYGIIGAAIGTAIVLSIQNLIAMITVRVKLKIMTLPWI